MNFERFHFNEISSTNEYIKELLPDRRLVAVTAEYQTKGRGRNGRNWLGDYGKNIYLSIGASKDAIPKYSNSSIFQAEASLIIKRVLVNLFPSIKFKIKYPNDILALNSEGHYMKLSGILIENAYTGNQLDNIIIGLGINCEQEAFKGELQRRAISLNGLGLRFDKEEIINRILNEYKDNWSLDSPQTEKIIFYAWASELALYNKEIEIVGEEGDWLLKNILPDCRLELISGSKIKIIDNGDSIIYNLK